MAKQPKSSKGLAGALLDWRPLRERMAAPLGGVPVRRSAYVEHRPGTGPFKPTLVDVMPVYPDGPEEDEGFVYRSPDPAAREGLALSLLRSLSVPPRRAPLRKRLP